MQLVVQFLMILLFLTHWYHSVTFCFHEKAEKLPAASWQ
ncbi:hypothetical protein BAP_4013 [Bacillus sp. CN2]|nr:hypothetical protein BAP_4013 [Bacillus sp. CN2]